MVDGGNQKIWKVGDRVFGLVTGGGHAEYCAIHSSLAMKIPDELTFQDAAAIPEAFITAFQSLYWLSDLPERATKPTTVLIHAGASGVGSACIQLCKLFPQVKVIATVGSKLKQVFCHELGADLAINVRKLIQTFKFFSNYFFCLDSSTRKRISLQKCWNLPTKREWIF